MDSSKYQRLHDILYKDLFIGVPASTDMGSKIALIAMICYLTNALKVKKPDITHADVIHLCTPKAGEFWLDQENLDILALVCDWFAFDCTKFPNLGIPVKEMPGKIKDELSKLCPF